MKKYIIKADTIEILIRMIIEEYHREDIVVFGWKFLGNLSVEFLYEDSPKFVSSWLVYKNSNKYGLNDEPMIVGGLTFSRKDIEKRLREYFEAIK